ncbi:PilN domain-containing protein [Methylosinus sp. PW1]|uniref:PilN domain-containing protein n=1 Tax=Methylosinus sp. PW1 TaxID=107636 RepID=UPI00055A968F|nr:PilN domain-containing protein [Methylosinus sp. PW1]
MPRFGLLVRWTDVLCGLVLQVAEMRRNRNMLRVTRSDGQVLIRAGAGPDAPLVAAVTVGQRPPDEVLRRASDGFLVLEWPRDKTITRTLGLPAQAREFLAGVITNQLDRLSPWPVGQILHSHVATPQADSSRLAVRVLIARQADVDAARAELAEMGLNVDRVESAPDAGEEPVAFWSSRASQGDAASRRRLRLFIGGAAAYVAICVLIVVAGSIVTNALQEETQALTARTHALQKRADAAKNPGAIQALQPPERAWIWKEASTPVVALVDALSRAIPDDAYLESLSVEAGKLRISGLAADAPPLIDALEKTGRFFDARFSASTTRASDGRLFRFGIEANLAAGATKKGK